MTHLPRRAAMIGGLCAPFLAGKAWASVGRVVIIGGGFGGATLAHHLRKISSQIDVTLVETESSYAAGPLSNLVLTGLRPLSAQLFGLDNLRQAGVLVKIDRAEAVDADKRQVRLSSGEALGYDRLVLSPGIEFRWDKLPGSSPQAALRMPHAWQGKAQLDLLMRQLNAIEDGGVVVMTIPEAPYRCPPAPYERASLIAAFLKSQRQGCKLILLDAKEQFSSQRQFEQAWQRLYPGLIEWLPPSKGGNPASIDASAMTVSSDFDNFRAAVANVIPPQRAGLIAERAGLTDRSLWCPVEPVSFASTLQKNIHVIGDAAIGGALPKSASAAAEAARICASVIAASFGIGLQAAPQIASVCYVQTGVREGFSIAATYTPASGENAGLFAELAGSNRSTQADASPDERAAEPARAEAWFAALRKAAYG